MLTLWSWFRRGAAAVGATAALIAGAPVVVAAGPVLPGCENLSQPPCNGAVPTFDQTVGVMAELTDPHVHTASVADAESGAPVLVSRSTDGTDPPPPGCDADCEQQPAPDPPAPYCHCLRRNKPHCRDARNSTDE